jgi:hypothetical protein
VPSAQVTVTSALSSGAPEAATPEIVDEELEEVEPPLPPPPHPAINTEDIRKTKQKVILFMIPLKIKLLLFLS